MAPAGLRRRAGTASAVVDQVEHEQIGRDELGRDRGDVASSPIEVALTRIFVLASSASMIESCQGIARSSMWAALRAEVLDQPLGPMEVAVEDDDPLEARA